MDEINKINLSEPGSEPVETKVAERLSMPDPMPKKKKSMLLPIILVGIVAGGAAGFLYAQNRLSASGGGLAGTSLQQNPTNAGSIKVGDTFGTNDTSTFKDEAEGILKAGGIEGEGSHHLERGANPSQWVYLTSSVVDLDMFVGSSVHVWGQTNQGKKAGWLMDVGKLKVLQLNAAPATGGSSQPQD